MKNTEIIEKLVSNFRNFVRSNLLKQGDRDHPDLERLGNSSPIEMLLFIKDYILPFSDRIESLIEMSLERYGVTRESVRNEDLETYRRYLIAFCELVV